MYTLTELNQMNLSEFVSVLGAVFEETPAIAEAVYPLRPFDTVRQLHSEMMAVVYNGGELEQQRLICAHPDLGSKVAMAEASVQEQAGAGLNHLTADEYDRFHHLNQAYKDKFGFPFIVAVKGHTKATILQAFEDRLQNEQSAEHQRAIEEIGKIAWYRLSAIIQPEMK